MFTFRIVLVNGEKVGFNKIDDVNKYIDKNNLRIKHANVELGYWELEGGGHITRV